MPAVPPVPTSMTLFMGIPFTYCVLKRRLVSVREGRNFNNFWGEIFVSVTFFIATVVDYWSWVQKIALQK